MWRMRRRALGGLCLAGTVAGAALLMPGHGAVGMAIAVACATGAVALLAHGAAIRLVLQAVAGRMGWTWPAMLLPAAALAVVDWLLPIEGRLVLVPGGLAFAVACWAACWLAGLSRRQPARVPA